MRPPTAGEDSRLLLWRRVREFAVPPSMIDSATARRAVGDWAGACAVARFDVDLDLRALACIHGRELAARIRADLRHLAPDLLRWHMPRVAPDGLLRPGLTVSLARYAAPGGGAHLVARTAPAWADAGQRISLAVWDESRPNDGTGVHPHPRPDRHFRLDLHRHLWDARQAGELWERSGAAQWPCGAADGDLQAAMPPDFGGRRPAEDGRAMRANVGRMVRAGVSHAMHAEIGHTMHAEFGHAIRAEIGRAMPGWTGCAVHRWVAEAAILLGADSPASTAVTVRLGGRHRLRLDLDPARPAVTPIPARSGTAPILPYAATWVLPDLELLHHGLIDAGQLHPLVAAAIAPDHRPSDPARAGSRRTDPRLVECRGGEHRIGLVNGVVVPLDHDPAEIRREELLAALGGPPLPCLRAIDEAHRRPECLDGVRARLDHGDAAGALDVVERLLGPDVLLRSGSLRDELEAAVVRREIHGLYRAGLTGHGPIKHLCGDRLDERRRRRECRARDRRARDEQVHERRTPSR